MKIEIVGQATATSGQKHSYVNVDTPELELCLMGTPKKYLQWAGKHVRVTIEEVEEEPNER